MQRFKRFFAAVFIVSSLLGALHEVIHDHVHDADGHYEQSCPLYLLSHVLAVPNEPITLAAISLSYEPFIAQSNSVSWAFPTVLRTRAPPSA